MTTITLEPMRVFRQVAEDGSFTRAAQRLRLDKSKVSRDIQVLEEAMNVRLFARSTRSVRLTAEGEALLARISPLLSGLEQAVETFSDRASVPAGVVRITATPDLGRELLAPLLVRFRARFPSVITEVVLTNHMVDLVKERIDLALRVGRPSGNALVAKKLSALGAGFFASPSYLARRGTPTRADHLAQHDGLWPKAPRDQKSFGGGTAPVPTVACSDFSFLAEMARAGGGIALLPTFLAARDVASGALVRVLPDFTAQDAPLFLVSAAVRTLAPRIVALRTFLLDALLDYDRALTKR